MKKGFVFFICIVIGLIVYLVVISNHATTVKETFDKEEDIQIENYVYLTMENMKLLHMQSFMDEEMISLPMKVDFAMEKIVYGDNYQLEYKGDFITGGIVPNSGVMILNQNGKIEDTNNIIILNYVCSVISEKVKCTKVMDYEKNVKK